MSPRLKIAEQVRRFRELSLLNGVVQADRVDAVLKALVASRKPHELRPILRAYLGAIRREIAKSEARVQYAGALSDEAKAAMAAAFTRAYGRPVSVLATPNPALIAGVRVRVGDDEYDDSAAGRLARLRQALA